MPIINTTRPFSEGQTTAFGEKSVANLTPIVQLQFPYNVNAELVENRSNNGTASIDSNRLKVSTGAVANQSSQVFSVVPIKYHPGQGGLVRFTTIYTTGVANSTQLNGIGDAGDGYFFGYNGATFGILRRRGGVNETRTLTITTKSTTAENITITLDGDAETDVTVTDATATDATTTANDIAAHDFSGLGNGWDAHADGDTVVFSSFNAESKAGTYSLSSATTAVGAFTQALTGVAATDTWTTQANWNKDTMDGAGASGMTLDQTKGNVYQIRYQWLGFGKISFYIEDDTDGELELVHVIYYANANTVPSVTNPTLPLCIMVANSSNTSDIVAYTSSMAGFLEGEKGFTPVRKGVSVEYSGIGTTESPLLTIHNKRVFQGAINRVRIKLKFSTISVEGIKPSSIMFKVNSVLTGASFSDIKTAHSVTSYDTSASAMAGGEEQLAVGMAKVDSEIIATEFFLNPGDTLTMSGKASSGTIEGVASFNWEELF